MSCRVCRIAIVVLACLVLAGAFSRAHAQCSADPWADAVVESSFTAGDPMAVLGAPDGVLADFEEVGSNPGFVTVSFVGDVIVDGPGDDFVVHIVDFPQGEFVEAFEVYASADGVAWVPLGMVFPTLLTGDLPEALGFDLAGSGLFAVQQLRVTGLNVDFVNQGEGVDIDAFEALNCEAPADTDLEVCLDDLDACRVEFGMCQGDLEICSNELSVCDEQLGAADAALHEGRRGLEEIRRLLALPRGQRHSEFHCSGELCASIQAAIDMLLAPPGQNHERDNGRNSRDRR